MPVNPYTEGKSLALTMSEVAMASKVVILDPKGAVVREGDYKDLKAEWPDEDLFFKRLRQLVDCKLVYVQHKK